MTLRAFSEPLSSPPGATSGSVWTSHILCPAAQTESLLHGVTTQNNSSCHPLPELNNNGSSSAAGTPVREQLVEHCSVSLSKSRAARSNVTATTRNLNPESHLYSSDCSSPWVFLLNRERIV